MTDTAWNLLAKAGVRTSDIEALVIVVDGRHEEIPPADAQARLEAIEIFTDFDDPEWSGQPLPVPGKDFGMQVWTADWIFRTRLYDGTIRLDRIARTIDVLMGRPK